MMLFKNLIIISFLSGMIGCQMFYRIVVNNDTEKRIGITILHFKGGSFYGQNLKKFTVLPKDSLIVKCSALRFVSIVNDYELIPVVVTNETEEILKIIRVCGHFLKMNAFQLHFPYKVSSKGPLRYIDLDIDQYFLAQDYFNNEQFEKCLNTIELVNLNDTLRINPSIFNNVGRSVKAEIEVTVKRGLAILGLISSKKLSRNDVTMKYMEYLKTNHLEYWNTIKKYDPEFTGNTITLSVLTQRKE